MDSCFSEERLRERRAFPNLGSFIRKVRILETKEIHTKTGLKKFPITFFTSKHSNSCIESFWGTG